jgi:hypothetical protein
MVPKREFVRVITEIMNPPKPEDTRLLDDAGGEEELYDDDDGSYVNDARDRNAFLESSQDPAPPTEPPMTAAALRRKRIRESKRDSFFFLQRSLELRVRTTTNNIYSRSPRTNQIEAKLDKMA